MFAAFIDMEYYTDLFLYVGHILHSRDKPHLVMVCNVYYWLRCVFAAARASKICIFLKEFSLSHVQVVSLCDPMDCSPPGSSVHGILQARILEWVAIPFSKESSQPRDQTPVSFIAGRFFTV